MATASNRNRHIILAVIAALVLAGGAWGVVALLVNEKKAAVPKEFSVEALKAKSQDPGQIFRQVHEAMQRNDLTEEQRHQIRENIHQVMEAQMDQRMNEYFTASEDQKKAILDKHIDEMQQRMKEMEQRRAQDQRSGTRPEGPRPPEGAQANAGGPPPGGPDGGPPPGGPGGRGPRGEPSREQRKMRSESRDPDRAAQRMAYFSAMRKRAEERGIQMPGPGGPGR